MYSSTHSLPRHEIGMSGQHDAPVALHTGKEPPVPKEWLMDRFSPTTKGAFALHVSFIQ